MIAALAILAAFTMQDTASGLSPRARALAAQFSPPTNGAVTVATRFSTDTAWIGQQVELVTAAWFPRDLRDRLRRQPTLRNPSLSGLWSAPSQSTPILAETRRVNGVVYDLFISHQILFPLGAGPIVAPPAVLSYAVPASTSFFAPEDRTTLQSRPARLFVRAIPASLVGTLGTGPTARDLSMQWRFPAAPVVAGTPVTVELVVQGSGNVTLWPAPDVTWPANVRVYVEPSEERIRRPGGLIGGEKRFRYTLVADSAGVLTLPRVRYPYFDPGAASVRIAAAAPLGVAVRVATSRGPRREIAATRSLGVPIASRIVRTGWPALLLLAIAPLAVTVHRRRRRPPRPSGVATRPLEQELRHLIGEPADAVPGRVAQALRRRGIETADAERVEAWLREVDRMRWGPRPAPVQESTEVRRVVERLRTRDLRRHAARLGLLLVVVVSPVQAQWNEALARFADGDAEGAARGFAATAAQQPAAAGAWLNLGAARALDGDAVGAVAAWIRGLHVAPRDRRLHAALETVTATPPGVRRLAPVIPLSRDELLILALVMWLLLALTWTRHRRVAWAAGIFCTLSLATAALRTVRDGAPRGLLRSGTPLRVSPLESAPTLGTAEAWVVLRVEREQGEWQLVRLADGSRGWVPGAQVATLSRLD